MLRYTLKRLFMMVLTVWIIATLTFILMMSLPGSPFNDMSERTTSEAVQANLERHYNLDKPKIVQYLIYLKSIATFDFGPSIKKPNDTVNDLIGKEDFQFQLNLELSH